MRGASALGLVSLLLRSSSTCAGLPSPPRVAVPYTPHPFPFVLVEAGWDGHTSYFVVSFRKRLSSYHFSFSLHAGGGGGGNTPSVAFQEIDVICHLASFIEVRFD
jgi:hypothetical protein